MSDTKLAKLDDWKIELRLYHPSFIFYFGSSLFETGSTQGLKTFYYQKDIN